MAYKTTSCVETMWLKHDSVEETYTGSEHEKPSFRFILVFVFSFHCWNRGSYPNQRFYVKTTVREKKIVNFLLRWNTYRSNFAIIIKITNINYKRILKRIVTHTQIYDYVYIEYFIKRKKQYAIEQKYRINIVLKLN